MRVTRLYDMLLRLYPMDFRISFAAEMASTFEQAANKRRELLSLVIGAAAEWIAKLSTDPSRRGRSLPDVRMMRPPGVTRELWFRRTSVE